MIAKFENIINSNQPIVVDFYADWCVPCKQMPPILKDVKDDLKENIRIIKVNVDKNPFIATKYKIRSIPTIMIFKNGKDIWKGQGVRPAQELKSVLRGFLNP